MITQSKISYPHHNCPTLIKLSKPEIEECAILAKTVAYHYSSNNTKLGIECRIH
jgi:ribosomal protein L30E